MGAAREYLAIAYGAAPEDAATAIVCSWMDASGLSLRIMRTLGAADTASLVRGVAAHFRHAEHGGDRWETEACRRLGQAQNDARRIRREARS